MTIQTKQTTLKSIFFNDGKNYKITFKLLQNFSNAAGHLTISYIDTKKSTSGVQKIALNDVRDWTKEVYKFLENKINYVVIDGLVKNLIEKLR